MSVLGPSGLVLGQGPRGPVTIRLFRPHGTRIVLGAPEYVSWLVVYRAAALGVHISVTGDAEPWRSLLDRLRHTGVSVDHGPQIPDSGLPYRPSLVLGDLPPQLGPWQAHLGVASPEESPAPFRAADLALVTPDEEGAANLRRAFFLTGGQTRAASTLSENQVAVVSAHRLVRATVRPAPLEYRALFG
ncbi:hypothetical protein [Propioniferax innocua]|uniref:Uncharacterized protein n=1 Tax=Propioniferax innocua TaxID=1753 RepID=A0A542ZT20_9ACTN|nr:hypothetical protein [Propioniferax innocua]TQL63400.1 hypothetical protein FB460_1212 [Propioniferax innocua]